MLNSICDEETQIRTRRGHNTLNTIAEIQKALIFSGKDAEQLELFVIVGIQNCTVTL